jgi:hypothetical protein
MNTIAEKGGIWKLKLQVHLPVRRRRVILLLV